MRVEVVTLVIAIGCCMFTCASAAIAAYKQRFLIMTEQDFTDECVWLLLDKTYRVDGLISQIEFAAAIMELCSWEKDACAAGGDLSFTELPTGIQNAFVGPLCASDPLCLIESEPEFGYPYTDDTWDEVQKELTGVCQASYPSFVSDLLHETKRKFFCVVVVDCIQNTSIKLIISSKLLRCLP
jgi:hypothetical protein